jgi:PAS domain S-box-containing protein
MQDLSGKKQILISGICLALLFAASIITIIYSNLTALKSIAFAGSGFSLGVVLAYYILRRERVQQQLEDVLPNVEYCSSIEDQTKPICQFLSDGRLSFVNDAGCNYFGKSREQLIGNRSIALTRKVISPLGWRGAIAAQCQHFPLFGILYDNKSADLQAYRFFNLSSDLLIIGNFEGYFTDLNPTWERTLGYTVQELTAQPFLEFVHPEDRESTQAEMEKLINGFPVIEFDNRYCCKDGSYKCLSWTAQSFLEEGLIYGIAHNISDVYEEKCLRKQVESVLQQQWERRLLGATLERIRQSLDLNEILATTVKEVRQLLQTERVLFLRLNDDKTGQVVAESAVENWTVRREIVFPNPEFPAKCYDFYSQGQLRVIPDLTKDDFASCLADFMQQVDVKSKIVVPIVQRAEIESPIAAEESKEPEYSLSLNNKLWGLLIVQACSDYRQWQQVEIELLASIANQLAIAIKQADLYQQVQTELAERKRVEEALRQAQVQLEIKVQQRTAQLTKSNQLLSAEIAERRNLEEVLRQRQQEFRALVENAPDIIARLDKDLRHLYINPAIEKATNIAPEEFIGKTNQELGILDQFVSALEKASQKVFAAGNEEMVEFHYPTPQGKRYYQSRVVPELATDGSVNSILAIGRDITELKQTEEALRVREYQLRGIFESVLDAITIVDEQGFYVDANPAASRLFKLPYAELIGKHLSHFMETKLDFKLLWREFQEQKQVTGITRLICLDGTIRDVEYSAIANFLPGLHLTVLHDVTERQQAENALRERKQQLTAIATNIPGAIYRCLLPAAGGMSLLYVSEGIKELVGIDCQEAIANPDCLLELIHPEDRTQFYFNKSTFKQNLQSFSLKYRVITQSGKVKWIRDSSRYFPNGTAGDVIVDGVILDISDVYDEFYLRKQAESALRENQRLLQQIADTTLTMIYIFDLYEQRNVYLNRFGQQFFGRTAQEIQTMGVAFFTEILLPEQAAQLDELQQRLISTKEGEILENELCLKNSHGEWRWFHTWEVVFTRTTEGKPQQILGTAIDITEQKRSQEICCALETEKELRKLQFRFFSMASHEFRTPLSTILVTTQLLINSEQEWSTQKRQRNLKRIEKTAKHMTQLLDDILTFNRAETGKLELRPNLIELDKFCGHLIGEMQFNAGSQYIINFSTHGDIKTACLDEKLLHSILTNLLSNAIKYSPEGGEINLTLIGQYGELIFQVQDYGIGIPLEYQQQPFEPFHRGSNIGNIPGTGLGLAVVKKCLDLQGGKISIDSNIGVGTIVIINIPIKDC